MFVSDRVGKLYVVELLRLEKKEGRVSEEMTLVDACVCVCNAYGCVCVFTKVRMREKEKEKSNKF